jgi:2-dehydropantoate 2-reductase
MNLSESKRPAPAIDADAPVVIWGAGAMGGTIGACIARTGLDVIFVDTVEAHVRAMREEGLRITGPIVGFTIPAPAFTVAELEGRFPLILLCVKAHHTEAALAGLLPHLADDGVVVSVQNGLNETTIARLAGEARTFGCFVNFGADYLEPGVVHYGGRGTVVVGEIDGRETPRARSIHDVFRRFDERAILSDNVWGYLWSKLAYASMLFGTALTDDGIADALDRPRHRPVYASLAREVVRVALARGVRLMPFDGFDPAAYVPDAPDPIVARSLDEIVAHNRRSAKTHSGIWRDLAVRRRRTEVDAQLGPVVGYAHELGLPAPLNERLIAFIHEIEDGARPQTADNLDRLAEAAGGH